MKQHASSIHPKLAITACGGLAVALTAGLVTGAGPAGAATSPEHFAYGGNAFGSHVTLGSLAHVGKTAYTPMCTTKAGTTHRNKTAKLNLGAAGYIGAVTSKMRSEHHRATMRSAASTHTAATTLLSGAVKLKAVTTYATVAHHGTHYGTAGRSTFVGLRIAGKTYPASPKANTKVTLPGLGSLTLNEQHTGTRYGIPTKRVIALDLVLGSKNTAGLPAGRIELGQSTATLRQTHRVPSGAAWATQVSVASVAGSGRTAAVYTGCGGTGNAGHSNDLSGVTIPNGVATVAAAHSMVKTTDTAAKTTSHSRDRVAGVKLFNGMIRVKALTTRANAVKSNGHLALNAAGTSVAGLVIDGKSVAAPKIGQKRSIPGLGTLTFGYATKSKTRVMVYGLRLVLGSAHDGVKAGAAITIGAARAAVTG